MPPLSIEERVAALEAEVVQIRHKVESTTVPVTPWWEKVAGTFAQDSVYNEAMNLGHQYRRYLTDFGQIQELRAEDWTV